MSGRTHGRGQGDRRALIGGALGDALGMPTQLLSPAQISPTYGFVDGFVAPSDDHPVSKGLPAGRHHRRHRTDAAAWPHPAGIRATASTTSAGSMRWSTGSATSRRAAATTCSARRPSAPSTPSTAAYAPEEAGRERRHQRRGDAHRAGRHHDAAGAARTRWSPRWRRPAGRRTTPRSPSPRPPRWPPPSATASPAAIGGRLPACAVDAAALGAKHGHWIVGADVAARIGWACELVRGKPAD